MVPVGLPRAALVLVGCLFAGGCSCLAAGPEPPSPITQASPASSTPNVLLSPSVLNFLAQVVGSGGVTRLVTLANRGRAPLMVTNIAATGDFVQTNTCGDAVAAGASCTISVTFNPIAPGARTGTLVLLGGATGLSLSVRLNGAGIAALPEVPMNPVPSGLVRSMTDAARAAEKTMLANSGTSAPTASETSAIGGSAQTNTCGAAQDADGNCALAVASTPTLPRVRSGAFTIVKNAGTLLQPASVSAQTGAPSVSWSPAYVSFGTQIVGVTAIKTVTLTNTGTADLTISQVSATSVFAQTNTCGTTVAAGGSCAIAVAFTPTSTATFSGTLTIVDNAANSPQSIALGGTGHPSLLSPTLSATALSFASQVAGTVSPAQIVTLTNYMAGTVAVKGISASAGFAQTNTCGTSVALGASCTISVTFAPTTSGVVSGALSIATSAYFIPQSITLSGVGYTLGPNVSLSPTPVVFASQTVGIASAAQQVTLANSGTAALTVSKISTTGNFTQTNNCGASVAAGSSCFISLIFTPTAAGTRTGTLTITDSSADSPQSTSLSGPGAAAIAKLWLSPASLTFGQQVVGAAGAAQSVGLTNTGTVALPMTQISTSGDFTQTNNCPSTIAVGAGCAILITFTPTAPGPRSGTLSFTDSAGDSLQSEALSGTGVSTSPMVSLSPAGINFPGQTLGTTSAIQTLTLTNSGGSNMTVTGIAITGDFTQTNNCPLMLAAGASCTVSVSFTPTVVGPRSGTVSTTGNAANSPQSASFSGNGLAPAGGAGCVETGTVNFPGCFSFASPTQMSSSATQTANSGSFQSGTAAQSAQLAALLDGSDSNPAQTLAALARNAMGAINGASVSPDPCFSPVLYYANDPEAAKYDFATTGQWSPGDFSIWTPTDSSGAQACSAAELNYLLSADQARTQFALALAAETEVLAGENFPFSAGQIYDATSDLTRLLAGGTASIKITYATVTYEQGSYLYITQFRAPNGADGASGNILCTLILIHTPGASPAIYSGIMEYEFDNGTTLLAGTTRYQRTSATHFDISVRNTAYPSRSFPQLDENDEIDPNDPNFIQRFSRFGASFDPTSAMTPGSYQFTLQTNASGVSGPGPAKGLTNTIQLLLPGDGTGSVFVGSGSAAINQPSVWQFSGTPAAGAAVGTIDHIFCAPQSGVAQLNAQFQPLQYDPVSGQYVPSTTAASQIRFAPTSTCIYTDAQWNKGAAGGFWYDRPLKFAASASQPATPAPIPQNVVADPNDASYLLNLFGDGSTQPQTLISAAGYTFPVLY